MSSAGEHVFENLPIPAATCAVRSRHVSVTALNHRALARFGEPCERDVKGLHLSASPLPGSDADSDASWVVTFAPSLATSIADKQPLAALLSELPEANPNIVIIIQCPDTIEYVNPMGRAWLVGREHDEYDELRKLLPEEIRDAHHERKGRDRVRESALRETLWLLKR